MVSFVIFKFDSEVTFEIFADSRKEGFIPFACDGVWCRRRFSQYSDEHEEYVQNPFHLQVMQVVIFPGYCTVGVSAASPIP